MVWAKRGTEGLTCPVAAQGHVGFVSAVEVGAGGPVFRVVGGNQGFRGGPTRIQGGIVRSSDVAQAISYRRIGAQFADRVLHSVRTKGFLRGALLAPQSSCFV